MINRIAIIYENGGVSSFLTHPRSFYHRLAEWMGFRSDDRAMIMDVDVEGVGAMDVSVNRSAAEFCTNVIARSDDYGCGR
jgi:hypothetical protein